MNLLLKWQSVNDKVSELTLRERLMLLIAGLVLLFYPAYNLLIEPWLQESQMLQAQLHSQKQQIIQTEDLINTIKSQLKTDPNKTLQVQRQQLLSQLKELEVEFREKAAEVVSPELMASLLKRVLNSSHSLKLSELSSIKPTPLLSLNKNELPEGAEAATLYSHGIKLKLTGTYFNIYHFLLKLEALPEKFYWKQLSYQTLEYPQANVEIEIYTLSTQKEFIGG